VRASPIIKDGKKRPTEGIGLAAKRSQESLYPSPVINNNPVANLGIDGEKKKSRLTEVSFFVLLLVQEHFRPAKRFFPLHTSSLEW
jgi:hypothetical protein